MDIIFSPEATDSIRSIQNFLKEVPIAFDKVVGRINICLKIIKNNPYIGKEGRYQGTRELFVSNTSYVIIYRIKEDTIEVITILHTSRQY
jgi:toxin ParE1/3/4